MPNIVLLWKHPLPEVMRKGPRFLEYIDHKGDPHIFEPRIDSDGNVTYELPEIYARRLLANQGDRFFLISPDEVVIRKKSRDGFSTTYERLKSVVKKPALAQQFTDTTPQKPESKGRMPKARPQISNEPEAEGAQDAIASAQHELPGEAVATA